MRVKIKREIQTGNPFITLCRKNAFDRDRKTLRMAHGGGSKSGAMEKMKRWLCSREDGVQKRNGMAYAQGRWEGRRG